MVTREKPSWIETASATNATATAARPAPAAGLQHFITSISGSFSGAVAGAQMRLLADAVELGRWYVHDQFEISFPSPVAIGPASVANLDIAGGGAGVIGSVNMTGYTL